MQEQIVRPIRLKQKNAGEDFIAYMTINDKNCNLSIVLTAMDKKLQKSYKGDTTHRLNINVMLSNIEAHHHTKFS